MQKHCIANTIFLFRGLCILILGKSSSEIHTLSAQWGIIVKENVSQLCYVLSEGRRKPFKQM